MPITFILGGILVFLVYLSLNFYIGIRTLQAIKTLIPFVSAKLFWPVFALLAFSFLIVRVFHVNSPFITKIGNYWIAAFFYLLLIYLLRDVFRWLSSHISFLPESLALFFKHGYSGLVVIGLVFLLLIYGTWNAQHPKVVSYDVNINKSAAGLERMKIVLIADFHVSPLTQDHYMDQTIERIKSLRPDLIVIAGDFIDGTLTDQIGDQLKTFFEESDARLGTFAVLGNHEYYGNMSDEITAFLKNQGVQVLRDEQVLLNDLIYIVGREDDGAGHIVGDERKTLEQLLADVDSNKPVILLDHQPKDLDKAAQLGIDLMFSGHTHGGQLFPFQIATKSAYGVNKGYLQKDGMQLIVTSGVGTWGPPMRIGSHSEIVVVNLTFIK